MRGNYLFIVICFFYITNISAQEIQRQKNLEIDYDNYSRYYITELPLAEENPLSFNSLQQWLYTPLDINNAQKKILESFPFFSPIDIQNIIQYRTKYKTIYTIRELSIILSLDPIKTKIISHFISFDTIHHKQSNRYWKGHVAILLKDKAKKGDSKKDTWRYLKKQSRFILSSQNLIIKGIGESDYGESRPFYDHLSGFIQYNTHRTKIIIGDFKPDYGQGLGLSNASFYSNHSPSAMIHNLNQIRGYAQADENNFFRGVAIDKQISKFRILGYFSSKKRDASIHSLSGKNYFSSLISNGIHISSTQKNNHNSIKETAYGGAVEYTNTFCKIIGYVHSGKYSLPLQKRNTIQSINENPYKEFLIGGASYHFTFKKFHLFGEIAKDPLKNIGHIHGLYVAAIPQYQFTIGYRSYPTSFFMPYGKGYAIHSSCKNEKGFFLCQIYELNKSLKLENHCSYFSELQPYNYHQIKNTKSIQSATTANYILSPSSIIQIRHTYKHYHKSHRINHRAIPYQYRYNNIRIQTDKKLSKHIQCGLEGQWTHVQLETSKESGLYSKINTKITPNDKRASIIQISLFQTESFQSRIYSYENSIPYDLSIPFFYGKGVKFTLLERVKISKHFKIAAKIDYSRYIKKNKTSNNRYNTQKVENRNYGLFLQYKL
ncbi:helix-hairpin-helix domain-containing protein [Halosquirtibacter laminarini]|uniref:Helix-hairpin-helix domain-containing protein n=1 Tax=Halosquirtibacter laminarini TaxID=3374600 RepID=A0AC61ND39_9BACT|nr:helix-hairpin-helix domain-containing protein [Prolixibacteraceae bacterium]